MRKTARILWRSAAGLLGLLAVLMVVCLDAVDHRPYFQSAFYAETLSRFKEGPAHSAAVPGRLLAGFGKVRLTPVLNSPSDDPEQGRFRSLPLAGFGSRRGKPATGAHDDLFVKAVSLRSGDRLAVMVSADALIIPREVAEAAAARLATEAHLAREQIYFGATHTHAGIGGWGEGFVAESFAGGYQPGARQWFASCLVKAAVEAISDLAPAASGRGSIAVPQYIRNRLVGDLGSIDPELSYLFIRRADGRTAVIGSYSAHATVLPSGLMEYSADYPGAFQRAVEQGTGGIALFFAGGVGSHSPVPGAKGFEGVEKMGGALAHAVLAKLPGTTLEEMPTAAFAGLSVSLPAPQWRLTDGIRLRPWLARRLLPVAGQSYLQVYRIGSAAWVSAPCDFSGELALNIKDFARRSGLHAVVTSFNGDYIGYVIPNRYYHMEGYEPRLMSFFGPDTPEYLSEFIRRMLVPLS
jgi:neutral ceramidase